MTPPYSNKKRILFVRADAIGDNILATGVISAVHAHWPEASLAIVCQARVSGLYAACPWLDKILTFDPSAQDPMANLWQELPAWQPDLVLNSTFSRDLLSDTISAATQCHDIVGFEGDGLNLAPEHRALAPRIYSLLIKAVDPWMPEVEKCRVFLEALGITPPEYHPQVWTAPADENWADEAYRALQIEPAKVAVFAPGAQYDIRIYQNYSETLASLTQAGFTIIGLGAAKEAQYLYAALRGQPARAVDLFGKTTLSQAAAILKRARLLLGAESGLAHMACAVGTPNVVILGGGHFGRFMPYSPLTSAIVMPVECRSCNWNCKFETTACVKDIDPFVVDRAVRDCLQDTMDRKDRARIYLSYPSAEKRRLRLYPRIDTNLDFYGQFGDVEILPLDGGGAH